MAASRLRFESHQRRNHAIPLPMPTLTKETVTKETVTKAKLKQPIRQPNRPKPKGKAIDITKLNKAKGDGLAAKAVLESGVGSM